MTKLLIVTSLAAAALVATPVAACDWNREASSQDPAIAAAPAPTQQTISQVATAQPQATSAASGESAKKPTDGAPVVLVTDRH